MKRIERGRVLPILYKKVFLKKFIECSIDKKAELQKARHILSWLFQIPKKECWKVMKELESFGVITIVPNSFIRLKLSKHEFFLLKVRRE